MDCFQRSNLGVANNSDVVRGVHRKTQGVAMHVHATTTMHNTIHTTHTTQETEHNTSFTESAFGSALGSARMTGKYMCQPGKCHIPPNPATHHPTCPLISINMHCGIACRFSPGHRRNIAIIETCHTCRRMCTIYVLSILGCEFSCSCNTEALLVPQLLGQQREATTITCLTMPLVLATTIKFAPPSVNASPHPLLEQSCPLAGLGKACTTSTICPLRPPQPAHGPRPSRVCAGGCC
jgi:hypothetical protein